MSNNLRYRMSATDVLPQFAAGLMFSAQPEYDLLLMTHFQILHDTLAGDTV